MPLNRPTLGQLVNTAEAEINALIPGADARMRYSVLGVFARVWAALTDGLYGALDFLSRQIFATTATQEYLALIADSYGITRLPATAATGCVTVLGTAGTSLPLGTVVQRGDGAQYRTTSAATLPGTGRLDVPVMALTPGLDGNAAALTTLQLVAPIAGVVSLSVCASGIAAGAEQEVDEALRARLLQRLRNPPGAGTVSDWERWARALDATVTRVWVLPSVYGNGSVGLVFAQDGLAIAPGPAAITAMQSHLAQYTPAGAALYVLAPTLKPVALTVQEQPAGDPQVRQAIADSVADLLYREGGPGSVVPLTHFAEAISSATGEYTHRLIAPVADVQVAQAAPLIEIAVLGTVTWA